MQSTSVLLQTKRTRCHLPLCGSLFVKQSMAKCHAHTCLCRPAVELIQISFAYTDSIRRIIAFFLANEHLITSRSWKALRVRSIDCPMIQRGCSSRNHRFHGNLRTDKRIILATVRSTARKFLLLGIIRWNFLEQREGKQS